MEKLNKKVNLLIKAPNQKISDHSVECYLDWTVKNLKTHISETYPDKPTVEEQKLIYSGRLLHDHLKLKDILRPEEVGPHILHLVCRPKGSSVSPMAATIDDVHDYAQRTLPSQNSSSSREGLRHRAGLQQINQNYPTTLSMPTFPVNPEQMAHQMFAMQQMYAYYMTQYLQYAQTAGNFTTASSSLQVSSTPQTVTINNGANQNVGAPERPVNENVRMNAQGGPLLDEDEEVRNRDWLDWFYIFIRGLVLFSIVYFYSSPGRLMIVTGLGILAYLYQGGWFGVRRQQAANGNVEVHEHRENQRVGDEQPQPPNRSTSIQQENQANQQEGPGVQQSEEIVNGEEESSGQQGAEQPVPVAVTAWTFISSFFSSLIPEQPAPVDIN